MPSATSPSEKVLEEKPLAGVVKLAPRKPAGVLATLRGWRYLYELWTGLYMLEFWEKCLFGASLGGALSLSPLARRPAQTRVSRPRVSTGRPPRSRCGQQTALSPQCCCCWHMRRGARGGWRCPSSPPPSSSPRLGARAGKRLGAFPLISCQLHFRALSLSLRSLESGVLGTFRRCSGAAEMMCNASARRSCSLRRSPRRPRCAWPRTAARARAPCG